MTKLQAIIDTLKPDEFNKIKHYSQLYHSCESQIHQTLDWYLANYTTWEDQILTIVQLHSMYTEYCNAEGRKPLSAQSFKNKISSLGNLVEEYIAWVGWKSHEHILSTSKLLGLAHRGLDDYYLKTKQEILQSLESKSVTIFAEYYLTIALFYDYYYQISNSKDNYTELFHTLVSTFKTGVGKVAQTLLIEVKNRERLINNEDWSLELEFFDMLYEYPTDIKHITDDTISLNEDQSDESYRALLTLLTDTPSSLSHFIRYSIATYCAVYLTARIKGGDRTKHKELLYLYEYTLAHKILSPTANMSVMAFINVVSVMSKVGTADMAYAAINKYANSVSYPDISVVRQLAIATVDFNTGEHQKVLKNLRNLEPVSFDVKFKVRWLQIKALAENTLEIPYALSSLIGPFERYLKSNKQQVTKVTYRGLISTIRVLKMFAKGKPHHAILSAIEQSDTLYEKKWLSTFVAKIK